MIEIALSVGVFAISHVWAWHIKVIEDLGGQSGLFVEFICHCEFGHLFELFY